MLVTLKAAKLALVGCRTVDDVAGWISVAKLTQRAGRLSGDKALEVDAAEFVIRAERRLGELLAAEVAT